MKSNKMAIAGLNFAETFGELALTTFLHAVGLRDLGPTMAPLNAFLTITGIETLHLSMSHDAGFAVAYVVADGAGTPAAGTGGDTA